ncbi:MAG: phage portal protein [Chloroflexota bacterium]|nr:phage portal protein [Chloroflexota bacterium]
MTAISGDAPFAEADLALGASGTGRLAGPWKPLATHPIVSAACNLADTRLRRTRLEFERNGEPAAMPLWATPKWRADFISGAIKCLWLHGNLFGTAARLSNGRISHVDLIDPTRMSVQHSTDLTWQWRLDGRLLRPDEELIHVRYSALPGYPMGLSAVLASALNIEMGVGADKFLTAHLRNGPKIMTILKPERPMGTQAAADLKSAIEAATVAPEVAWRPMVLSGVEVTQIAYSMADGQFRELATWSDARLCAAFNIDPTTLGVEIAGQSLTYQNVQQRDQLLWADSLSGLASRMELFLSEFSGADARFDEARWLLGGITNRAAVARNLTLVNKDAGMVIVTPNEIRDVLGLPPTQAEPAPTDPATA